MRLISLGIILALSPLTVGQRRSAAPPIAVQINGQLRYSGGTPAENLVVRLEHLSGATVEEALTDRTGKFRFSSLNQGQYVVSVHLAGFRDIRQPVDLETATSQYLPLQLLQDESNSSSRNSSRARGSAGAVEAGVPATAQSEFDKGQTALQSGRTREGIERLEKAVTIYPGFFKAQLLLGTTYMDEARWDQAARALRQALEINGKSVAVHFALGEVYLRQKRFSEAEASLLNGLKLDDNSWQGHLALGRVYWEVGNIAKAGPQVGRALQLKPDLAEAHLLAGNLLLRAHQRENAVVEFEEYLRLAPNGELAAPTRATVKKIKQALAEKSK